jgi:N-methylhydantoinase B
MKRLRVKRTGENSIELALYRHLLVSIAEEMGVVLRKTSYSANIKERRDYSCAVYDGDGEALAMGDHMPVHLGAMPMAVREVRRAFELAPGDVAIVNDPFRGGTHLPDITAVSAVFLGGKKPAFFLANRAHHADVGGMSPGSMPLAREIYQEGLRLPPVLLVRGGEIDRPMLDLVLANVRTPVEREGDLLAQLMSLKRGEQRLAELLDRYGLARARSLSSALLEYSDRMMRAALRALPEGEYQFQDVLDDDGISAEPLPVRVWITLQDGTARVDFTGSAPQAAGPMNANYAICVAATMYVFRCLLSDDVPFTAGLLRPIEVMAPEGTVVNARPPAAMAAGNVETSQRITDVLLGALAKAAPDRIPAASSGTMNNLSFGGWDRLRGRAFAYYETIAGGMGASAVAPGASGVHTHMTNSWNTPVEAFEHQYPLRVRRYGLREGSAGQGTHAGGEGIVRELEFLEPAEVTIVADRRKNGPYGLEGGTPGAPGRNILIRSRAEQQLPGKTRFGIEPGEVLRIETPGGGGWGKNKKGRKR